jgi:hypothetical protein
MVGKSQPVTEPNTMHITVSNRVMARINRFLKMKPNTAVKLTSPTGKVSDATFCQWYGNHGLFFIDDPKITKNRKPVGVTIAMWILDFPTCIKVVRQ